MLAAASTLPLPHQKDDCRLLDHLQHLWQQGRPCFSQSRVADRTESLLLSSLLCLGRHTMTGLLTTLGSPQFDWSAAYRLLARQRLPCDALFAVVRRSIASELPPEAPFCAALDDTVVRRGRSAREGAGRLPPPQKK